MRGLNISNNNESYMDAGEMRVNEHSDLSSITLLVQTPSMLAYFIVYVNITSFLNL